jgi:hypothetical protein
MTNIPPEVLNLIQGVYYYQGSSGPSWKRGGLVEGQKGKNYYIFIPQVSARIVR